VGLMVRCIWLSELCGVEYACQAAKGMNYEWEYGGRAVTQSYVVGQTTSEPNGAGK